MKRGCAKKICLLRWGCRPPVAIIERMATSQNPPRMPIASRPLRSDGQGRTKGWTAWTALLKLKGLNADYLNGGTINWSPVGMEHCP